MANKPKPRRAKTRKPLHAASMQWRTPVVDEDRVLPSPSHPMAVARELVKRLYTLPSGIQLRHHRGDFYAWDGTKWPELHVRDLKKRAYEFVEDKVYVHVDDKGNETLKPFAPTVRKMNDLLDALMAVVLVRSHTEPPLWIEERVDPPAHELIAMTNGLLHVPTRKLYQHSAQFFNHHSLAFAYHPQAPSPSRWLAFLRELWPEDDSSIETLQEVFEYLLSSDTSLQKIFSLVGPKRGGKSTIGRVLTGLLGPHHVAAPTLASLSTNFGLQPLIGKPLALVSDARLSTKADSKVAASGC